MATEETRKRVVITIAGSPNDAKQLGGGWKTLAAALAAIESGKIIDLDPAVRLVLEPKHRGTGHFTISAHRNFAILFEFLTRLANIAQSHLDTDYVLVMAAGWLAVLPGLAAGYLYHGLHAKNIIVIGVALKCEKPKEPTTDSEVNVVLNSARTPQEIVAAMNDEQRKNVAALLAMTQFPGADLLISGDEAGQYFGPDGFTRACEFAVNGQIPDDLRQRIADAKGKEASFQTWTQAIAALG